MILSTRQSSVLVTGVAVSTGAILLFPSCTISSIHAGLYPRIMVDAGFYIWLCSCSIIAFVMWNQGYVDSGRVEEHAAKEIERFNDFLSARTPLCSDNGYTTTPIIGGGSWMYLHPHPITYLRISPSKKESAM